MGCFVVSSIAAIGVGAMKHIVKHNEKEIASDEKRFVHEVKWSKKLSYLELTLWSGSFILAGEHMIHGEVVPFPPFLTAMANKDDTIAMLHEMGTVGVGMLAILVFAWAIGVLLYDYLLYKKHKKEYDVK